MKANLIMIVWKFGEVDGWSVEDVNLVHLTSSDFVLELTFKDRSTARCEFSFTKLPLKQKLDEDSSVQDVQDLFQQLTGEASTMFLYPSDWMSRLSIVILFVVLPIIAFPIVEQTFFGDVEVLQSTVEVIRSRVSVISSFLGLSLPMIFWLIVGAHTLEVVAGVTILMYDLKVNKVSAYLSWIGNIMLLGVVSLKWLYRLRDFSNSQKVKVN